MPHPTVPQFELNGLWNNFINFLLFLEGLDKELVLSISRSVLDSDGSLLFRINITLCMLGSFSCTCFGYFRFVFVHLKQNLRGVQRCECFRAPVVLFPGLTHYE